MKAAAWILTRFGVDDVLIGDLIEQRNGGKSEAWLWRQVVAATVSVVVRDVMAHPARTAIALFLAMLLRYLTIRVWGPYEPSIDMSIGAMLIDVLGRPALLIAVSWVNAIVLVPAWFAIGLGTSRLSPAAVLLFVAVGVTLFLADVILQLEHAIASDMVRWLVPVQVAIFVGSIGAFALSTLFGAVCGLDRRHEVV